MLPAATGFAAFGVLAHEVARLSLEDELGRRLSATAVAVAMQILPEQISSIGAGDEPSRTYANLVHRLELNRDRFGVRRIALLAPDGTARGDSAGRVALGAQAHAFAADAVERAAATSGRPSASPLFIGKDGRPYKRGYAAIARPGEPAAGLAGC